jgi:hypothetical protein
VRSVNGTDYDTSRPFEFTVTPTTTATTLTTNIPASFLNASRTIRWNGVTIGTNSVATGVVTVNRLSVGGFVP